MVSVGILERLLKGDAAVASFKRQLRNVLGFTPGKAVLYRTALTHRSVKDGADENNERLEYLGDAILSAIIADFLFKKYPYKEEGDRKSTRLNSSHQIISYAVFCLKK